MVDSDGILVDRRATHITQSSETAKFNSKPAEYDQDKQSYVLNLGKRVQMGSSKNMQLVDDFDPSKIYLQFGKYKKDTYHLDCAFPFSIVQAISVGLSVFQNETNNK